MANWVLARKGRARCESPMVLVAETADYSIRSLARDCEGGLKPACLAMAVDVQHRMTVRTTVD